MVIKSQGDHVPRVGFIRALKRLLGESASPEWLTRVL